MQYVVSKTIIIGILHLAFAVSRAIMRESVPHVSRDAKALLMLFDPIRERKDGIYSFLP